MKLTQYGGVIPDAMMSGTQTVVVTPQETEPKLQEANVVIEQECDDEMPVIRKVRRERVEDTEENQPAQSEEVGISTDDALVNYTSEPTMTLNVWLSWSE